MSILFDNPLPAIGCGDPGDPIDFAVCAYGGAYWSRSFNVAGNRTKWALAFEIKSVKGQDTPIFGVGVNQQFLLRADGGLQLRSNNGLAELVTARRFRDYAAHLSGLLVWDSTMPAPSDRVQLFVEDELITDFDTDQRSNIAQGSNSHINGAEIHYINNYVGGSGTGELLASRLIFLDGIKPTPADFGYRNSHGAWVLRKFAGEGLGEEAYGATGFHQNFVNAIALMQDVSGNGNHFTPSGLTAANQVIDTPINNFCVLNPLVPSGSSSLSSGNLRITSSGPGGTYGTLRVNRGVYKIEARFNTALDFSHVGWQDADNGRILGGTGMVNTYLRSDGDVFVDGVIVANVGQIAAGSYIGVRLDLEAGTVSYFRNGDPLSGPHAISTAEGWTPMVTVGPSSGVTIDLNCGQKPFVYDIAPDALAVCTANGACPAILKPDDYVIVRIRTGGAGVNDLPFDPITNGAVVISHRLDIASGWRVNDSVTGVVWETNTANADLVEPDGLTFTANGYDIGANTAYQGTRIDYIFRRSPKAGFDIVPISHVTGTPTIVPHKAGGVIDFALYFPRSGGNRRLFHKALGSNAYMRLNNNAGSDPGAISEAGCFQSTANTLTLGASTPTGDGVLLVWRSVPGLSVFEKYVGKNSVDGAFVPFDFSPRICMFRLMGAAEKGLLVIDADRDEGNPVRAAHVMSNSDAETITGNDGFDMNSNGLKFRAIGSDYSGLGNDHIICAWAQTPGKFARAR